VVVALHDLNAAATYATHAVLMKAGTVSAIGTARELLAPEAIRDVFGVDVEEVI
jgi:iron complex transport system ATP-binding protein